MYLMAIPRFFFFLLNMIFNVRLFKLLIKVVIFEKEQRVPLASTICLVLNPRAHFGFVLGG